MFVFVSAWAERGCYGACLIKYISGAKISKKTKQNHPLHAILETEETRFTKIFLFLCTF